MSLTAHLETFAVQIGRIFPLTAHLESRNVKIEDFCMLSKQLHHIIIENKDRCLLTQPQKRAQVSRRRPVMATKNRPGNGAVQFYFFFCSFSSLILMIIGRIIGLRFVFL